MDPKKVEASFRKFVAENTPESMTSAVHVYSSASPVMLKPPAEAVEAMKLALAEAFGKTPAMIRMGATVPIVEVIQRRLGMDAVLMGFGLPGDGLHSPNERFMLDQFYNGSVAAAAFIQNYAESYSPGQKGSS
jgi:acetylornithine deacetylase/succinyl-diaminopimelate desuccinylase-like protein